jgi:hypothetical protein
MVSFHPASPEHAERGLLGWVSFDLNDALRIEGVAVRRKLEGGYTLSFPARREIRRRKSFYVRPLDEHTRLQLEQQILSALGLEATQ